MPAEHAEEMSRADDFVKPIEFTQPALRRIRERGVTLESTRETIRAGQREIAQHGLASYRRNFDCNRIWDGRYHRTQQGLAVVAEEDDRLVVVTVYAFYFQEEETR